MAIKCDVCNADVTPKGLGDLDDDDNGPDYSIIQIKGDKVCLCIDCEDALYEYYTNGNWKKDSARLLKQIEEENKEA